MKIKTLTRRDWARIEEKGCCAFENTRGCRNAVEAEFNAVCAEIHTAKDRKFPGWEGVNLLICRKQINYGTRRWTDWRNTIEVIPVAPGMYKETNRYVYGILKDRILAVVKR